MWNRAGRSPRISGTEGKAGSFSTLRQPGIRALFPSGHSSGRIRESFFLLPGIEFLRKPQGPASLVRRVREVLEKV